MQLIYKPYEDDEEEDEDEPEPYELLVEEQNITDIKSAAGPRPRSALLQNGPSGWLKGAHSADCAQALWSTPHMPCAHTDVPR